MSSIFCFFYLILLVRYLRGLEISEIRCLSFRGLIWIRFKNSGSFRVGQVPRTSHAATRPKKRRICPSLSRPFAAGPASSFFVAGCRRCPWYGTHQAPGYSHLLLDHAVQLFFFLFSVGHSKKYSRIVCCCCMFTLSLFFASLSPPKCMRQGRMVVVLYQESGRACYIIK